MKMDIGTKPLPAHWSVLLVRLVLVAISVRPALCTAPNIVFIFADDLGWNDVGFNNPDVITPNIDGLARSGVILNQSYVQPVCTPSRSAFMTGVYPFRLGLQHLVIKPNQAVCAPYDRPFLPEVLKGAGYATHAVGKWHLGFCNKLCTPTYRGFDSFLGYYNGAEDYYTKEIAGGFDFRDNELADRSYAGNYSTYQYTARIRQIIAAHDTSKPMFLYLPYQSVHSPLQVPQKYLDMYNITDKDRHTHVAMVTALDDSIGDLVDALKTKGIYNNTLLVFTGDNGGMVVTGGNNYPLRGSKATVFEGGTRVAAFLHGPALLPSKGMRYDGVIHAVDWFPTLLQAAGIKTFNATDQDGVSQWLPLVRQTSPSNRNELVYNIDDSLVPVQGKAAIRVGDYKLIDGFPGLFPDWYKPAQLHDRFGPLHAREDLDSFSRTGATVPFGATERNEFLFNLKDDPNEHVNLYDKHPDIVKQLRSRLEEHRKRYVKPNYPAGDPESNPKNYGGAWTPGWC